MPENGTERPPSYAVFLEGSGFGAVIVAWLVHVFPDLWIVPAIAGSIITVVMVVTNNRYLRAEADRDV